MTGWNRQPPVGDSEELQRVLALPRRARPTPEQSRRIVEVMTRRFAIENNNCRCAELRPAVEDPCIKTLRPIQAWALLEMMHVGGMVGPIGVGHGKTLMFVLAD